jgi:hypothetical protein
VALGIPALRWLDQIATAIDLARMPNPAPWLSDQTLGQGTSNQVSGQVTDLGVKPEMARYFPAESDS